MLGWTVETLQHPALLVCEGHAAGLCNGDGVIVAHAPVRQR